MTLDELSKSLGKASETVLENEVDNDPVAREELLTTMRSRIDEMRDSIRRGLASKEPSRTGMVGWNARTLHEASDPLNSPLLKRVQEYAMRYLVTVRLVDAEGTVVVPTQDIQLERSYQFETIRAQGTPGEEEVVRAELERDMVQAILRRIDAVLTER